MKTKRTVYVQRFVDKDLLPFSDGLYMTDQGFLTLTYMDNGKGEIILPCWHTEDEYPDIDRSEKVEWWLEEMHVADRVNNVIKKINKNIIGAWEGDLQSTVQAVALEDFDTHDPESGDRRKKGDLTKYNGWFDDLKDLLKLIK